MGKDRIALSPSRIRRNFIPIGHWRKQCKSGHETTIAEYRFVFSYKPHINDPRTTILLVEDNKDVAIFVKSIFSTEGYHLIYCHNGEEALKMANERIPDIVITDVLMPRMNGLELCKAMKQSPLLSHIPVIIISAKSDMKDYIEGLRSGADAYIRKPFQAEELQVRVENLLMQRHLLKEKYHRTVVKEEKMRRTKPRCWFPYDM